MFHAFKKFWQRNYHNQIFQVKPELNGIHRNISNHPGNGEEVKYFLFLLYSIIYTF